MLLLLLLYNAVRRNYLSSNTKDKKSVDFFSKLTWKLKSPDKSQISFPKSSEPQKLRVILFFFALKLKINIFSNRLYISHLWANNDKYFKLSKYICHFDKFMWKLSRWGVFNCFNFPTFSIVFKRARSLKISTLAKMCLINTSAKFWTEKIQLSDL